MEIWQELYDISLDALYCRVNPIMYTNMLSIHLIIRHFDVDTTLGPVVNYYKECVKGVSKNFKPIYGKNGKITLDWIEKKDKVEEAKELDGKFTIMSTDLDINCKEIVDAYFEKMMLKEPLDL
jgi:hypothetical protein